METLLDPLMIIILALNLFLLSVSRLRVAIQGIAAQGALVGSFLLLADHLTLRLVLLAAATMTIKGYLIPKMQMRALRETDIHQENKPLIGFMGSLILGAIGMGLAVEFASRLPLAEHHKHSLLIPAALSTVWTGFLLLTTRTKAIMQVVGYLTLENGIILFGLLLAESMPFLVEIGVLLDVFTGVFVLGIIIHHISREFGAANTDVLSELKG